MGQHFLRCPWVTLELMRAADIGPTDTVVEVGPGTGALTRELTKRASRVIAVEKDERLAAGLRVDLQKRGITNVEVVEGDILRFSSMDLVASSTGTDKAKQSLKPMLPAACYKLVGNIPYYLTSRLIRQTLEMEIKPAAIVFTIQKEVAERITAHPPYMNLLALAVQISAVPEIGRTVPRKCFSPKPKVDSAILKITPRPISILEEQGIDHNQFFSLARKAFGQKRKMLGTSLKRELNDVSLPDAFKKKRPQALFIEEWIQLYQAKLYHGDKA